MADHRIDHVAGPCCDRRVGPRWGGDLGCRGCVARASAAHPSDAAAIPSASLDPAPKATPSPAAGAGYVFLSYSRSDSDYVARLHGALSGTGVRRWYEREIPNGARWDDELRNELMTVPRSSL
jgi:TIR domain